MQAQQVHIVIPNFNTQSNASRVAKWAMYYAYGTLACLESARTGLTFYDVVRRLDLTGQYISFPVPNAPTVGHSWELMRTALLDNLTRFIDHYLPHHRSASLDTVTHVLTHGGSGGPYPPNVIPPDVGALNDLPPPGQAQAPTATTPAASHLPRQPAGVVHPATPATTTGPKPGRKRGPRNNTKLRSALAANNKLADRLAKLERKVKKAGKSKHKKRRRRKSSSSSSSSSSGSSTSSSSGGSSGPTPAGGAPAVDAAAPAPAPMEG